MSPGHFCSKCNDSVVGNSKYGCFVCKRINISRAINGRSILHSILGLPLPYHILLYIANLSFITKPLKMIVHINGCVWRTQNYNKTWCPSSIKEVLSNKRILFTVI